MQKNEMITVTGMSCATCASTIDKVLGKTNGVTKTSVNLATEKAAVEFDDDVIKLEDIYKKIEGLGYGVIKKQSMQEDKLEINIDGMSCAACSVKIDKVLNEQDGITKAFVNLTTEKATVEFDKSKIDLSEIINKINALGYKASLSKEEDQDAEQERRNKEVKRLKIELIASIILSSPLLLGMILMIFGINIPFLHNAYFQLAVATPVQFVIGFKFYKNAF